MPAMTKAATKRVAKQTKKIARLKSKGKTKRAARVAARQSKIIKTGKTGAGRAIVKAKKIPVIFLQDAQLLKLRCQLRYRVGFAPAVFPYHT